MNTEIERHTGGQQVIHAAPQISLSEQMEFAKAITESSMVPKQYQHQPANALLAINLGQAMGLNPAESLNRIDVIQGKPTASAELIASNVRKAGHKLRIDSDDKTYAKVTIIRADDPDSPVTVTRDMEWAKQMGLTQKENYKKMPGTMLQWRAITACARLACSEALYGVIYTPDEMTDLRPSGGQSARPRPTQSGLTVAPVETEAGVVQDTGEQATQEQVAAIQEHLQAQGVENGPAWVQEQLARTMGGWDDITSDEADTLISTLTEEAS